MSLPFIFCQRPDAPQTFQHSLPWNSYVTGLSKPPYEIADFSKIEGVPCPCGTARRAFTDVEDFPGTVHITEISMNAQTHYHKILTETYFFLECDDDAKMQLNDEIVSVRPGMSIIIRPGTLHRAIGKMKVLIMVLPKFDPEDEYLI